MFARISTFLVASVLALATIAAAQTGTGSVAGTVLDLQSAVVPGATVTLRSDTGAVRTTVSDSGGRYTFQNLAPGPYVVFV